MIKNPSNLKLNPTDSLVDLMRLRIRLFLSLLLLVCAPLEARESDIRAYPYPFSNMLAFSSDVDLQTPSEGVKFHELANKKLGLPISDSLWVKTAVPRLSGIFNQDGTLNRHVSGHGLPTYFSLIREWHRGNIDHFHSWQSDVRPSLRYEFRTEDKLSLENRNLDINWPGNFFKPSLQMNNITLLTRGRLSEGSAISLLGIDKVESVLAIRDAIIQENLNEDGLISYSWSNRAYQANKGSSLPLTSYPSSLSLLNFQCSDECSVSPVALVLSDFSRRDVVDIYTWLSTMGITPNYTTSHGGRTRLQNYSDGYTFDQRKLPVLYDDENLDNIARTRGNKAGHFAYHSDLLRHLGVRAVWPWDKSPLNDPVSGLPTPTQLLGGDFYRFERNSFLGGNIGSEELFLESMKKSPVVGGVWSEDQISEFYCGKTCNFSQGDMVDFLLAVSLSPRVNIAGRELFWYTHFGSGGNKELERTLEMPFEESLEVWLTRLANAYYSNTSGHIKHDNPIWVQSASTFVNYTLNRPYVRDNTIVDKSMNRVNISSWVDEVNNMRLPNTRFPSSDLHGFTFSVNDPSEASIFVDGVALDYFMPSYNPVNDESFITVVDTSTPSSLIPGSHIDEFLKVETILGKKDACENELRCDGLLFSSDGDGKLEAKVELKSETTIWNSPYLLLELREQQSLSDLLELEVEIQIVDGQTLLLSSNHEKEFDGAKLNLDLKFLKAKSYFLAPLYLSSWKGDKDCDEATRSSCDVLNGKVHSFNIRTKFLNGNTNIELKKLSFLRANPLKSSVEGDNVLIGGRVLLTKDDADKDYTVVLDIESTGEKRMIKTDSHGVFLFPSILKNTSVKLSTLHDSLESELVGGVNVSKQSKEESLLSKIKDYFRFDSTTVSVSTNAEKDAVNACNSIDPTWVWVEKFTADIELKPNRC